MGIQTRQRQAIRAAIEEADRPLSPQEVREAARAEVPQLGLATVYRNLNRLLEQGWLETVDAVGEGLRYERAGKAHHHHYHCCDCDRVFDLEGCGATALAEGLPEGFTIESHEIVVHGRCSDCGDA